MSYEKVRVSDLRVGDHVDLAGDFYADNGNHPEFEFETVEVLSIEQETPECIAVQFDDLQVGFPPWHVLDRYVEDSK